MSDNFVDIEILDNFYQTSSFYPMPVVLIGTVSESGQTNLGPYSLCFPYIISGKKAMMLICRNSSNTAINIMRNKKCSINFIPNNKKYMKNCVMLGYPGETTEEKMKNSMFNLIPSETSSHGNTSDTSLPEIVKESVQVFECTWDESFPLKYEEDSIEYHFVLKIDKILMKEKYKNNLFEGKSEFPDLPIDYGYRNNINFWFAEHKKPYKVPIPKEKGISIDTITYAVERIDPSIKWEDEACIKLVKIPRVFLNNVLRQIIDEAKKEGLKIITADFLEKIRNKRK